MKKTLVSIAEFCRRRDLSRTQFYEHEEKGNLKPDCFETKPGGKRRKVWLGTANHCLDRCVRQWPAAAATKKKFKGEAPATPEPEAITDSEIRRYLAEDIESLESLDMAELQKRHEIEKILAARLKRRRDSSEVVDAEKVRQAAFSAGKAIKEQVGGIPDRLSALVAVQSDLFECKKIMQEEIDFVLDGLSEKLKVPGT